jgi:hypothetical protein
LVYILDKSDLVDFHLSVILINLSRDEEEVLKLVDGWFKDSIESSEIDRSPCINSACHVYSHTTVKY